MNDAQSAEAARAGGARGAPPDADETLARRQAIERERVLLEIRWAMEEELFLAPAAAPNPNR